MKKNHSWSIEDCLFVINEFVHRYKNEDFKKIEQDIAKKIGTSSASVNLTRSNFVAILKDKKIGFGSNASALQKEAINVFLENSNLSKNKLIYILE